MVVKQHTGAEQPPSGTRAAADNRCLALAWLTPRIQHSTRLESVLTAAPHAKLTTAHLTLWTSLRSLFRRVSTQTCV